MTASEVFGRLVEALDRAQIPYMLTGSFASSLHGTPRATQDIDLVIATSLDRLLVFVRSLPVDRYYVSEAAAVEAHRNEGMFNVLDLSTGWKVDLILRKSRPFSCEEFERRTAEDVGGVRLYVASPEDVIVAKMEWAKRGGSARQIEDAAGILRVRGGELDRDYIERWTRELGLEREWDDVRRTAT